MERIYNMETKMDGKLILIKLDEDFAIGKMIQQRERHKFLVEVLSKEEFKIIHDADFDFLSVDSIEKFYAEKIEDLDSKIKSLEKETVNTRIESYFEKVKIINKEIEGLFMNRIFEGKYDSFKLDLEISQKSKALKNLNSKISYAFNHGVNNHSEIKELKLKIEDLKSDKKSLLAEYFSVVEQEERKKTDFIKEVEKEALDEKNYDDWLLDMCFC